MDTKLANIYQQIPVSFCIAKCGVCCGPVFPSLAELRNIKKWCGEKHLEYRNFLDITEDGSCPYLNAEKECLVYPVRPFLCRLAGVSVALACPVGGCAPSRLLNKPQSDALYKAIYLHGKEKSRTEKHRRIVREVLAII